MIVQIKPKRGGIQIPRLYDNHELWEGGVYSVQYGLSFGSIESSLPIYRQSPIAQILLQGVSYHKDHNIDPVWCV